MFPYKTSNALFSLFSHVIASALSVSLLPVRLCKYICFPKCREKALASGSHAFLEYVQKLWIPNTAILSVYYEGTKRTRK